MKEVKFTCTQARRLRPYSICDKLSIVGDFLNNSCDQTSKELDFDVKTLRSYNALELSKSSTTLDFFANTSIIHQTSCVETAQ